MKIRDKMLPVLKPKGDEHDIHEIAKVIESGWWGKGPKVAEFEEKFAKMVGHKYAVAVTSNSHALDLVLKVMGFGEGVDIINPAISFVTTAAVPLWNNCTSNIVDVKPDTMCIDPQDVEKYKKPNSEALIAVNQAGIPCDYEELRKVFGGFIIEDCAHSCYVPGAGQGGDVALWSFQAVKTMPTGDGGMITTNDKELAEKCRELTWFGVSSTWSRASGAKPGYAWDYEIDQLGWKYYMIDLIAALGLSQMTKIEQYVEHRRNIQSLYNDNLHPLVQRPHHSETVQYYCAKLEEKIYNRAPDGSGASVIGRNELIDYLATKNIHTSVHFKPLYLYKPFREYNNREYPVADVEWKKLISLPCHNDMSSGDVEYVYYWVNKWMEEVYLEAK